MEPEGSLQCSEQLSTTTYPEPDKSSPHLPILTKISYESLVSPTRATYPANLILLDFITVMISGKSTNCEAPHYAFFFTVL
jgi:hypothetical protein